MGSAFPVAHAYVREMWIQSEDVNSVRMKKVLRKD